MSIRWKIKSLSLKTNEKQYEHNMKSYLWWAFKNLPLRMNDKQDNV